MDKITGKVAWVYGDHFDIDLIVGVQNIGETDINKLIEVTMKNYNPDFVQKVKPGQILLAGRNFGYGHPHPQAMRAMRHLGLNTIIAKSFARVFFKNEIQAGMTLLPCKVLPDDISIDEVLEADLDAWTIKRISTGQAYDLDDIPPVEKDIIKCQGIIGYFNKNRV